MKERAMHTVQKGFSLVELMVVMGILAVIAAFALPAYVSYTETAEDGRLINNVQTMRPFQEDFFLRNGAYAVNLADIDAIDNAIGWRPRDNDGVTYSIANGDGTTYSVTAVGPEGATICRVFPANDPC